MDIKKPTLDDLLNKLVYNVDDFLEKKVNGSNVFCLIVCHNDENDNHNFLYSNITDDTWIAALLRYQADKIDEIRNEEHAVTH